MELFAEELINYCSIERAVFSAKEIITRSEEKETEEIGIVVEGTVFLESIDENGVRRILDYYSGGDLFRKQYLSLFGNTDYVLYSKTKCEVVFLSAKKMTEFIQGNNRVNEITAFFDRSIMRQLVHVHILEQHTMRQKILAFLENESAELKKNPFTVRISFTDSADYMGVDRSAMMREI